MDYLPAGKDALSGRESQADRRSSNMAAQPKLGLFSEQQFRFGSAHLDYPDVAGKALSGLRDKGRCVVEKWNPERNSGER